MDNIKINLKDKTILCNNGQSINLHTPEGYEIVKKLWEYTNWSNKYSYNFTWLGRPIIQLPDDMIRIQELIFSLKPDVVIETGIAHGGSLVFYASLLSLIGKGVVVGIDIEIRSHNRKAINEHPLSSIITLIEGSSTENSTIEMVKKILVGTDKSLIILDSCHSKEHVLKELNLYADFIKIGSYMIVADGIMKDLKGAPGAESDWDWNNPVDAVEEFLNQRDDFIVEEPKQLFKESNISTFPSYCPKGFLKKVK